MEENDVATIMHAIGKLQGQMEGVAQQSENIGERLQLIDREVGGLTTAMASQTGQMMQLNERMKSVEESGVKGGAKSGGFISVGVNLIAEGLRAAF